MKPIYILGELHKRPTKAFTSIKKLADYMQTKEKHIQNWKEQCSFKEACQHFKETPLDENYGNDFWLVYHGTSGCEVTLLLSRVVLR